MTSGRVALALVALAHEVIDNERPARRLYSSTAFVYEWLSQAVTVRPRKRTRSRSREVAIPLGRLAYRPAPAMQLRDLAQPEGLDAGRAEDGVGDVVL